MKHQLCTTLQCPDCHSIPLILREAIVGIQQRLHQIETISERIRRKNGETWTGQRCTCQYQGQQQPKCPVHTVQGG